MDFGINSIIKLKKMLLDAQIEEYANEMKSTQYLKPVKNYILLIILANKYRDLLRDRNFIVKSLYMATLYGL